jgi:hypothetical protein
MTIRNGMLLALVAVLGAGTPAAAQECSQTFDSTYELIQQVIFENRGCTSVTCHNSDAAGGLDLSADVSWENLIEQPSETIPAGTVPGLKRVVPGQKDQSLLFLNLAAATLPDQWQPILREMPLGLEPLTTNELDAVREWIEQGAPREGTVPGTGELLDACLPPARPIPIVPLPAPHPDEGRQVKMPKWSMPAESEDEVCFASYYDISDGIPAKYLSADGQRVRFKRNQIRQDPLSHHLIVTYYNGTAPHDDPSWGPFRCRGGEKDGEACAPTDLEFCGEGLCGSQPRRSIACIGFGPGDSQTRRQAFSGTQEASFDQIYPEGVYGEVPTKGLLIWNSHAFNLSDVEGKLEAWINFEFAEPEDQVYPVRPIFNTTAIFEMNVPPFQAHEICNHQEFPPDTRLFQINSHTHQRGKRFRVFDGRYVCHGGPNNGAACSPVPEMSIDVVDACGGSPCVMFAPPPAADCNGDGRVTINELTTCVNVALGSRALNACPPADPDESGRVTVAELIAAVRAALVGAQVDAVDPQLLYTNLVYNDPTVVTFDPARIYSSAASSAVTRTLTYCSLYDNGASDPEEVKRRSTSPPTPFGAAAPGGPCAQASGCTEGQIGAPCSGNNEAAHRSCDSSPGAGDGFCDACMLRGGVTTEDEMFILMGGYFVEN